MLKNILKLDGAQKLSKKEQKSINGATAPKECPWRQCLNSFGRCSIFCD